jgi:hypothetical protein
MERHISLVLLQTNSRIYGQEFSPPPPPYGTRRLGEPPLDEVHTLTVYFLKLYYNIMFLSVPKFRDCHKRFMLFDYDIIIIAIFRPLFC